MEYTASRFGKARRQLGVAEILFSHALDLHACYRTSLSNTCLSTKRFVESILPSQTIVSVAAFPTKPDVRRAASCKCTSSWTKLGSSVLLAEYLLQLRHQSLTRFGRFATIQAKNASKDKQVI